MTDEQLLDELRMKVCDALSWAYVANTDPLPVLLRGVAEIIEQRDWHKNQRNNELHTLKRVIRQRNAYREALEEAEGLIGIIALNPTVTPNGDLGREVRAKIRVKVATAEAQEVPGGVGA